MKIEIREDAILHGLYTVLVDGEVVFECMSKKDVRTLTIQDIEAALEY